jgi:hypothetical protein
MNIEEAFNVLLDRIEYLEKQANITNAATELSNMVKSGIPLDVALKVCGRDDIAVNTQIMKPETDIDKMIKALLTEEYKAEDTISADELDALIEEAEQDIEDFEEEEEAIEQEYDENFNEAITEDLTEEEQDEILDETIKALYEMKKKKKGKSSGGGRKWDASKHPRDKYGRFISTGGTERKKMRSDLAKKHKKNLSKARDEAKSMDKASAKSHIEKVRAQHKKEREELQTKLEKHREDFLNKGKEKTKEKVADKPKQEPKQEQPKQEQPEPSKPEPKPETTQPTTNEPSSLQSDKQLKYGKNNIPDGFANDEQSQELRKIQNKHTEARRKDPRGVKPHNPASDEFMKNSIGEVNLSKSQRDAQEQYSTELGTSDDFHSPLHKAKVNDNGGLDISSNSKLNKTYRELEDSVLSQEVPFDMVVHRGQTDGSFMAEQLRSGNLKPGSTVHQKSFTSTSIDEGVSEIFGRNTTIDYMLPKGSRAAYLNASDTSVYENENEMLLPANAIWKVKAVQKPTRTRKGRVLMELVEQRDLDGNVVWSRNEGE